MSNIAETVIKPAFTPVRLHEWPLVWQLGALIIGVLFLTLSSYIEVPMFPVPITMQTFAVTLTGALYGWRLGSITITAWLIQGALGMPVLAGGAAGIGYFFGPTGGYLLAFPIAGAFMGWLAERGWNGNHVRLAFTGMLISNGLCLLLGAAWLSVIISAEKALVSGIFPFLIGVLLKSALGAVILWLLARGKSK